MKQLKIFIGILIFAIMEVIVTGCSFRQSTPPKYYKWLNEEKAMWDGENEYYLKTTSIEMKEEFSIDNEVLKPKEEMIFLKIKVSVRGKEFNMSNTKDMELYYNFKNKSGTSHLELDIMNKLNKKDIFTNYDFKEEQQFDLQFIFQVEEDEFSDNNYAVIELYIDSAVDIFGFKVKDFN